MQAVSADIAGVVIADATVQGYPLTYVSPGFEQLTGYRAEQVLGRNCSLLQGPRPTRRRSSTCGGRSRPAARRT